MRALQSIRATVAIPLVVTALFAVAACSNPLENASPTAENQPEINPAVGADWMGSLADDIALSNLLIPGTHDSMTFEQKDDAPLSEYVKTQTMDVSHQLQAGVRYLDIRIRPDMHTYHNFIKLASSFSEVLDELTSFLNEHSSETILLRVKDEADKDRDEIEEPLKSTLSSYRDYLFTGDKLPALGDSRGKIILFNDTKASIGYGFTWDDPNTSVVQDNFELPKVEDKAEDIKKLFREAQGSDNKLHFNHVSATSVSKDPSEYAKELNPRVGTYIKDHKDVTSGVVIFDFLEQSDIDPLIERNTEAHIAH